MSLTQEQKLQIAQQLADKRRTMNDTAFQQYLGKIETAIPRSASTTPSQDGLTPSPSTNAERQTNGARVGDFSGGALFGFSAPGRTIQNLLSRGVDKVFGTKGFGEATKEGFENSLGVDVDTTAGRVGQFVGETATFAIPGGAAANATRGASLVARAAAQGLTSGAVQLANSGELDKDVLNAAIFGAVAVPAGDALGVAARNLSTSFPNWLVKPLLKQAKDAKVQGKDIAPFLVKTGRVGSVDSLINQTDDAINTISSQVNKSLESSANRGVIIAKQEIAESVAERINTSGGATTADEVLDIVDRLAPQARGFLKRDALDIVEANRLRSLIDRTLGDRGFLRDQLPYNKEILRNFTNTLRETIKTNGDETLRPLFDEYAKNITLRNALIERASSGGGVNSVGLYDLITGVGAYGFTGDPVTALGAAGARRVFESGFTKTSLARVFRNSDKAFDVLSKATPEVRASFLTLLDEIGDDPNSPSD